MFKISIVESDKEIQTTINRLLAIEIKKMLSNIGKNAETYIKQTIITSIQQQPEYSSLLNGRLKYEFGLPDADSRVASILSAIQDSLTISYVQPRYNSSSINASFEINMIPSDFNDILNLPEAVFTTEKGTQLQWLKWLLLEGDSSIVFGYQFILGQNPFSRTGGGIMRSDSAGVWRVPPEFAGTINNNWITRAITNTEADINNFFGSQIKQYSI